MRLLGHQGDLVIFSVNEIPESVIQDKQTKDGVLAYGEASGHAHQLEDPETGDVFKEPGSGMLYIRAKAPLRIAHGRARGFTGKEADHDYHNPIDLPEGLYGFGIVEETDWLTKTVRKVID